VKTKDITYKIIVIVVIVVIDVASIRLTNNGMMLSVSQRLLYKLLDEALTFYSI
jgi:hypothetical protein